MNRRKLAFLLVACMVAAIVAAGCSQSKEIPIVGQWKMTGVQSGGVTADLTEMPQLAGLDITFDFGEDGTCKMLLAGEDVGSALSYKVDGDSVTIEGDGETMPMTYDEADNTLTWKDSSLTGQEMTIVLTKG